MIFDFEFYLSPVFWAVSAAFVIQALIYLLLFRKVAAHKPDCEAGTPEPVTVVIIAKDEADNLRENLPAILEQDYPKFEVILVDDQSEDGTQDVLAEMTAKYPHLKVRVIEPHINDFKGKKLGLTLAFKAAAYDTFLMTDADCVPVSNKWLEMMQGGYKDKSTEFVIGYSPYKAYGGLLNLIIRYETFYTALQYFSFALAGRPYMGVGRNLSYRKNTFFNNKGFSPYLKVAAGDDDLFVNMHATEKNAGIQLCPDSFMVSEPKRKWKDWIRQKKRHTSVSKYYKGGDKRRLGMLWMANFVFYAAIAAGCLWPGLLLPTLGVFLLRMILQCIIFGLAGRKLYYKNIWIAAPLLDIFFQLLIMPYLGLVGMFSKKREW